MIENYTKEVLKARNDSRQAFEKEYPNILEVLKLMDEYFVSLINRFTNNSEKGEIINYKLALIVSFIRSQLIISEHIINGELIEANVIERKQLELIARLSEIDKKSNKNESLNRLIGKTPNVGNGNVSENLKNMYNMYSEIAHSSKIEPFSLLMENIDNETIGYSVLPQFNSSNMSISLSNHIQIFFDFVIYMFSFQEVFIPKYNKEDDMVIISHLINKGKLSKLSVFDRF